MDDDKSERERRLAAALRANLQRRKQQARQPASDPGEAPGEPEESGSKVPGTERPVGKA
jgi:hypothetical protein